MVQVDKTNQNHTGKSLIAENPSGQVADFDENMFNSSPIGIYIVQDRRFMFVNSEFRKILGYPRDELLKMHPSKIVHPEDWERVRTSAIKMLQTEHSSPYVYRALNRNGDVRNVIETVASIQYGGRRATLGYFMDNTENERTKEALSLSEEKFRKAFRFSPDPFIISTLEDGLMIDVNEAFLRVSGFIREEVVGHTVLGLGLWVDPGERTEMVQMLREQGQVRELETRFRIKSGEIRFVLWSAEIIDYGEEKCLIAILRDVTARKQAELDIGSKGLFM